MYISIEQITDSLKRISSIHPFFGMSFLAFKSGNIPVGRTEELIFTKAAEAVLQRHYRVTSYAGFFNPFQTSDKENRWTAPRYASTSLQRITTDTFSDTLIHPKKSSHWGWQTAYIEHLSQHLKGEKISAFDLSVWLFRNIDWPDHVSPETIRDKIFLEYGINGVEIDNLFDIRIPELAQPLLRNTPVSDGELLQIIGYPPGSEPEQGAALRFLRLKQIGPSSELNYEPAERLNIITGDNSLGKTFLLECIWWALTKSWIEYPAFPRRDSSKGSPSITYEVATQNGRPSLFQSSYDWDRQQWKLKGKQDTIPGLVIYARADGSFGVWDPARSARETDIPSEGTTVFLKMEEVWNGLSSRDVTGRESWVCNGLLRDWATWQSGSRYKERWSTLATCLDRLSPTDGLALQPGELTRTRLDSRDMPTIRMPYGDVPVIYASAGVKRVISLAYMLVWIWFEHIELSEIIRRQPQRRIIVIIDEVEAHLHPKWQRVITPAIMNVLSQLSSSVSPQLHLATHSPLVLASSEPDFDNNIDGLHHLEIIGSEAYLAALPFVKRGTVDSWLMSEAFGLLEARSLPGQEAVNQAEVLQAIKEPDKEAVKEVDTKLITHLAPDDEFWPTWNYFAKRHGARS